MIITETKEIEVTLTVMDDNNAKYKYQQKKRVNGLLLYKMKYQQTDKNNSNCYDQFPLQSFQISILKKNLSCNFLPQNS